MADEYVSADDIVKATGITRSGVLFYEKSGLIKVAIRAGRFKLFEKDTLDRVKRIQELKRTHTLPGIRELLDKENGNGTSE